MEEVRKVLAVVVGILILVAVVLLARWTGEKIREKFLVPKLPVVITNTVENPEAAPSTLLNTQNNPTATVSAIPSTGPEDFGYLAMGLVFVSGLSSLALARRKA